MRNHIYGTISLQACGQVMCVVGGPDETGSLSAQCPHPPHTERMARPLHACARVMSVVNGLMEMGVAHVGSLSVQVQYEASHDLRMHAVQVMSVVKGLMKTGMTICATIHSPTPFCFRLFDRMMILLRGHMVYAGPNGAPSQRLQPQKLKSALFVKYLDIPIPGVWPADALSSRKRVQQSLHQQFEPDWQPTTNVQCICSLLGEPPRLRRAENECLQASIVDARADRPRCISSGISTASLEVLSLAA